jgi:UDP-N-acetylmuramoyl-tripeptide--D-alanyl-D-alanine ligase
MKKINPILKWWVTPELPDHDIFELPLLRNKSVFGKVTHLVSRWLVHPLKRRLARRYLKILQRFTEIKVIGVTGSAGKSTTVQMLASILQQSAKTSATPPSIDPIYNVPNTILKTPPGTKFLILEFSVEYPGEMDFYLWLAQPDIGVIINIFPTHTEFLESVEGVFQEKSKLVKSLDSDGFAVLNKDDQYLRSLAQKIKARVIWFGSKSLDPLDQNAEAAKAVAKVLGIDKDKKEKGLKSYLKPKHRFEIIKHKSGAVIFDDSYNSNPEALLSTLRKFAQIAGSGNKIAVLGDMLELGSIEEKEHRRVGKELAKSNFGVVIGVGKAVRFLLDEVNKNSKTTKTYFFPKYNETIPILTRLLKKNTFVLIKGSRSIGLDKLVDDIIGTSRL